MACTSVERGSPYHKGGHIATLNGVSVRGKDLDKGKHEIPWEEREAVHTFDDGWTIERVRTPADLSLEGELMYHCARDHQFWVHKGVEMFFSLRSDVSVPKATIYCKPMKFYRVDQPEDEQVSYGGSINGLYCGYGSTEYEHSYTEPPFTFQFEGEELYVNHVSTNYSDREQGYLDRVKTWLGTLGVDTATLAEWTGRLDYSYDY